ncbi:helix-turn-helix transcriptional regulator [Pseudovibrio sp. SPO723]|uniref:AraC family transcriptional regulator n=1 Tax=Nesiotobacter zosterae TaxID=392721 RepID=UPI0029C39491|nr:helix-turn-helix transcriptional regulator [Pseudovibrio sp. SPO723]MDX5594129.1 helix-turn-helix transcriptional regulator [Pseudovibrio sp. SPO723]
MEVHREIFEEPEEESGSPVIAYAADMLPSMSRPMHNHDRGQLLHIFSGSLLVHLEDRSFFVPPDRAVWVPPRIFHRTTNTKLAEFRTLYIREDLCTKLPDRTAVISVTPLFKQLIMALMSTPRDYEEDSPVGRIARVLVDQIGAQPVAPLALPLPKAERLRSLCERISSNPKEMPVLQEAAGLCFLSPRTFERRFKAQTGMSFGRWCRQARLLKAVELLSDGASVSDVSFELGYEGTSAFIAAFKKAFTVTPGQYLNGEVA